MRNDLALALVAGTAGLLPLARADASTIQTSGFVDVHAGYGSNPFFDPASAGGSPLLGATVSGTVSRLTALSRTSLTGQADLSYYPKHYGQTQNYTSLLRHNQQLSSILAVSGQLSYENAINPSPSFSTKSSDLQPQGDLLTVGQRTKRISANTDITWEPNEKNLFQAGLNASHATFSGGAASAYNAYGASVGYLRTFNARTKIGLQGGFNSVHSSNYPSSKSFTLGLQVMQQISSVWKFDGGLSLLLQSTLGQLYKTLGGNGSLCGTYPRFTVCAVGSRQTAPSGFGGLRTDTQAGGRLDYKLSPRSTVVLSATYDISTSSGLVLPSQKYYDLAANYRRELTPRLSFGISGRTQGRDYGALFAASGGKSKVTAYTATVNAIWKFGRIG